MRGSAPVVALIRIGGFCASSSKFRARSPSTFRPAVSDEPCVVRLAVTTPGSWFRRPSSASAKASRRCRSAYCGPSSSRLAVRMRCGVNPGEYTVIRQPLFTISPAPISSTRASATSPPTRTLRVRRLLPPDAAVESPFRASCGLVLHSASAGATPVTTTVSTHVPAASSEHSHVDAGLGQPGNRMWIHPQHGADACLREEQPSGTAQRGEQQRLDQQLSQHSERAGAKRDADSDLLVPGRCARQEQIRGVRAGNHQHERHRNQQHRKRATRATDQFIVQRHETQPPVILQGVGLRLRNARTDRLDLRAGKIECGGRPQSGYRAEQLHLPGACGRHEQGLVDVDVPWTKATRTGPGKMKSEVLGKKADNGDLPRVQRDESCRRRQARQETTSARSPVTAARRHARPPEARGRQQGPRPKNPRNLP